MEPRTTDDLIQARLGGRLTRRELLERAAHLGLGLPIVGVILHATGEAAWGAPNPGQSAALDRMAAKKRKPVAATERTKPKGRRLEKGVVTAGTVGKIDTLNPYLADPFGPSPDILAGITEGLLAYNSAQQLRPRLAERYEIADDGITYTFYLRPGVTFHNGEEFAADDVVNSWQMIMNEDLPAWSRVGWDKIDRIDVTDPLTIVVTTKEVYAPFLSNIATGTYNNAAICPSRLLGRGVRRFIRDMAKEPVGTGPMAFAALDGDQVVLKRSTKYWGGKPHIHQILVNAYPDHQSLLEALKSGQIQVASRIGGPGASLVKPALAIDDTRIFSFTSMTWGHFDLKQVGMLREQRVRQALAYATPVDGIIDDVLGGEARRSVADQAPGTWAFRNDLKPREFDLKKAASLLERSGLTRGDDGVLQRDGQRFTIQLWAPSNDPMAPDVLQTVAAAWNQLGIETREIFAEPERLWGPMGYQYNDEMTACYQRWSNVNDPDDMFYWHSSQIPTHPGGPGGNVPPFFRPYTFQERIDELTSRAAAEIDVEIRKQLYFDIQELLHEQSPALFLFWDTLYAAAATNFGGFWPSAYTHLTWNAKEWYLTK